MKESILPTKILIPTNSNHPNPSLRRLLYKPCLELGHTLFSLHFGSINPNSVSLTPRVSAINKFHIETVNYDSIMLCGSLDGSHEIMKFRRVKTWKPAALTSPTCRVSLMTDSRSSCQSLLTKFCGIPVDSRGYCLMLNLKILCPQFGCERRFS